MEPQPPLPRSVNIETVGWGSEGTLVLKEIGSFLGQCGITVHCWIPSAPLELLITAPGRRSSHSSQRSIWMGRAPVGWSTVQTDIS